MKNIKVYFLITAVAFVLMSLAGCSKDPAEIVTQRSLERWNLLINHEAIKAYEYLSPGYRATHTLDQYVAFVATARLKWRAAKVTSKHCDADACTVNLTITSIVPGELVRLPKDVESESPVAERWILSDGQWYFLPDSRLQPVSATPQAESPHIDGASGAKPAAPAPTAIEQPKPENKN